MSLGWKTLFRSRSSGPVSRCRLPDERRGSGRADRDDGVPNHCKPAKLDGAKLDGVRPARSAVECLKAALMAEREATAALAAARTNVRDCLAKARQGGAVTYSAIATAITQPRESVAATIKARKLAASALVCRAWEAKRRQR
jgi:hypothetical protein